jgi:adenylate cyclase
MRRKLRRNIHNARVAGSGKSKSCRSGPPDSFQRNCAVASAAGLRSHGAVLRWLKRRAVVHGVIVALFALPVIWLLTYRLNLDHPILNAAKEDYDDWEHSSMDRLIKSNWARKAPALPEVVLLSIDAESISLDALDDKTVAASKPLSLMKDGFPFSREVYADVCDRLIGAGAKVVAFDLIFQKPFPADEIFQQALDKYHDHVVIGSNFTSDLANGRSTTFSLPPASLLPDQDPFDERVGYINFWPDSDGVVRCALYRNNPEHENEEDGADKMPKFYSLDARIVEKAGYGRLIPDDLEARPLRFAGPGLDEFKTYSLYRIFDSDSWQQDFQNGEFFRDKIVLVGPEGNWSKDVLPTPWGVMAGAKIHVNAINSLIESEFLHPFSIPASLLLVVGTGLAAFLLAMLIPSIAGRFAAGVLVLGGYLTALMEAYNGPGWLLPAVGPIGVFGGAMGVGFVYDFVLAQVEKMQLRAAFQRYTSPNVAKYLLDHLETYQEMLAGARQPVTVLFSDVRGFTTMTEVAASEGKSQQHIAKLNEYLTEMVACVFRHDGALDKFIGDAVMAVWGNTPYNFGPKDDAVRAVRAAREMLVELKKLNAKWKAEGRDEWRIGIGLNHGDAIVGDMGSRQRTEYAVIGDAVNLASRLESLTKEYNLDLLLGESVADLVRDVFYLRTVDLVVVKGKTSVVETFTVVAERSEALPPEMQEFLEVYEEGIRAFRGRAFERAADLFGQALGFQPGDWQTQEYLANCREFIRNPPDEEWTGVRVMTKK